MEVLEALQTLGCVSLDGGSGSSLSVEATRQGSKIIANLLEAAKEIDLTWPLKPLSAT